MAAFFRTVSLKVTLPPDTVLVSGTSAVCDPPGCDRSKTFRQLVVTVYLTVETPAREKCAPRIPSRAPAAEPSTASATDAMTHPTTSLRTGHLRSTACRAA